MAVSGNLGFIIGPALAGLLGATLLGEVLPVLAAFGISALALALIQLGLVDVAPQRVTEVLEEPSSCDLYGQEHRPAYAVKCPQAGGLRGVLALPGMAVLMAVNFLVMLGFSFFYVAFPVHAVAGLGWAVTDIGLYFAALSLAMIVVQGPVLAYLSKLCADGWLMSIGGAVLAVGFAALTSGQTALIYVAALLVALGNGLMWPTFQAVLSKAAGAQMQGAVQGVAQGAGAVASIAGLVIGGIAYVALGGALFGVAAGVIAASALIVRAYPASPKTP